jgi:hypothetical protein
MQPRAWIRNNSSYPGDYSYECLRRIFSRCLGRQRLQISTLSTINATPTSRYVSCASGSAKLIIAGFIRHLVNTFPHVILLAPHRVPVHQIINATQRHVVVLPQARSILMMSIYYFHNLATLMSTRLSASDRPGEFLLIAKACSSNVYALSIRNQEASTWEASLRHLYPFFIF